MVASLFEGLTTANFCFTRFFKRVFHLFSGDGDQCNFPVKNCEICGG